VKLEKRVDEKGFAVIVPDHAELASGTSRSILRQANMTREEFLKLLYEGRTRASSSHLCGYCVEFFYGGFTACARLVTSDCLNASKQSLRN
jgi:hypothetical protein